MRHVQNLNSVFLRLNYSGRLFLNGARHVTTQAHFTILSNCIVVLPMGQTRGLNRLWLRQSGRVKGVFWWNCFLNKISHDCSLDVFKMLLRKYLQKESLNYV